jgi:hypothetical protein
MSRTHACRIKLANFRLRNALSRLAIATARAQAGRFLVRFFQAKNEQEKYRLP